MSDTKLTGSLLEDAAQAAKRKPMTDTCASALERWRSMWEKEQSHNEQLTAERDRYKARAEQAEKALAYYADKTNWIETSAAIEHAPVSVQEAARVLLDVVESRAWSHYPIEMPLTKEMTGPAKVGVDAHCMTYEVWEADTLRSVSDHNKLPNAIEAWLRALMEDQNDGTS